MEFAWKDTLHGDYFYSNNMHLEYYSVLYNLGVIYSLMGRGVDIMSPDCEEAKHKDAIKCFQYAAWIFDKIKAEITNNLTHKEISPDLSENNLTFNSSLCLAYAQIYVLELAAKKDMDNSLQAQLCRGVFELMTTTYNIAKDSMAKAFNDETRLYLNNRRFFYYGLCYFK